jgi:hypothetical protein
VICAGIKYRKNEFCFDEEGMEGKREMKETLRKFREEDDSKIKCWKAERNIRV